MGALVLSWTGVLGLVWKCIFICSTDMDVLGNGIKVLIIIK